VGKKVTLVSVAVFCLSLVALPFSVATDFPISDANKTSFIAVTDSGASQNRISGGWTSILPKCDSLQTSWCINSLEVDFGDGKFKSAKFLRYVEHSSEKETPPANSDIPKSAISIWSAVAPGGTEKTYAVHSVLSPSLFSSSIYAFKEIKSSVRDDRYNQMGHPTADYRLTNPGYVNDCVFVANSICAQRVSFDGANFRIAQNVSSEYSSWFAGRIKSANVIVNKKDSSQSELVISGGALKVPHVLLETPGVDRFVASGCSDLEAYSKKLPAISPKTLSEQCAATKIRYENCFPVNKWDIGSDAREACSYSTVMNSTNFSVTPFSNNVALFKPFLESIGNSSFEPEIWSFQSSSQSTKSRCLDSGGYIGILSTNALVYDAYPPKIYDSEITYRVASPHLNSRKEVNLGVFEFQLSTKVMRCLYDFDNAPLQVTVSVVEESGEKQVATSTWSEVNEILRVNLSGFHYSAPEIKLKISKSELSTSTTLEKAMGKKTIVCVKGKASKKVTAVNPKCPTGFKKSK
jgi:hypothetical protein